MKKIDVKKKLDRYPFQILNGKADDWDKDYKSIIEHFNSYNFECEAGYLINCLDFQEFVNDYLELKEALGKTL